MPSVADGGATRLGAHRPDEIRFSVVIPTTGRPDLVAAVEDVLGQHHANLELIVALDGCEAPTPLTTSVDDRLRFVSTERRSGPGAARNAGAGVATGDWLTFLDDDDRVSPAWLSTFAAMAAEGRVGLVRCAASAVTTGDGGSPVTRVVEADRGLAGTFAMRREVFEVVGGFDPQLGYGENTELCLRVAAACRRRGLTEQRTELRLVTVQWQDRAPYPPDVVLRSALRMLQRNGALLDDHRQHRSHVWGIAGVNAVRLGEVSAARRYFVRAVHSWPRSTRAWARLGVSLVPGLARRVWRPRSGSTIG